MSHSEGGGPHRYLHSGSLNDGVQELVVLGHLLGGHDLWLTGVTLIVVQQRDKGCRHKHKQHAEVVYGQEES